MAGAAHRASGHGTSARGIRSQHVHTLEHTLEHMSAHRAVLDMIGPFRPARRSP